MKRLAGQYADVLGHLAIPLDPMTGTIPHTGLPWAADNGAFSGFDGPAYLRMLATIHRWDGCVFVTAPDVVAHAARTLQQFDQWEPMLHAMGFPVALVAQDGLESDDVPWSRVDALFVGGSTDWKLSDDAADVCCEAKRRGLWLHMGRVNSERRIRRAMALRCDSVDGTCTSMFPDKKIPLLANWIRREKQQPCFQWSS